MAPLFCTMKRSQNEIFGMSVKAARGAGHPMGLAEDMARATLWLCQNHFDGIGVLITELRLESGPVQYETSSAGIKLSGASTACLAVCGMDGLAAGLSKSAILENVTNPLMLLGICADASKGLEKRVDVDEWAVLDNGQIISVGDDPKIGDYRLKMSNSTHQGPVSDGIEPTDIPDHRWSVLEALAARTYVPATAESRAAGAGAGLTDND